MERNSIWSCRPSAELGDGVQISPAQEAMTPVVERPLEGIRIVEWSDGAGAAFAGRLLATLGAETILAEPPQGSRLRSAAPFLPGGEASALFSYLSIGKKSVICD